MTRFGTSSCRRVHGIEQFDSLAGPRRPTFEEYQNLRSEQHRSCEGKPTDTPHKLAKQSLFAHIDTSTHPTTVMMTFHACVCVCMYACVCVITSTSAAVPRCTSITHAGKKLRIIQTPPQVFGMFSKHDTAQRGCLTLAKVYQMIGEKKSIFGDSLFELIGKRYVHTTLLKKW